MSAPATHNPPEPGQLVVARGRRFVATTIKPSSLPGSEGSQNLVTLSSVEDDSLGEELQVVWELELDAQSIQSELLPEPTAFDDPSALQAFLDAVRWGIVSNADLKSFHAPFRSGIEIEDYQLDPLVRAVQMPRVNLLIADAVGLGKTIEAGLIVQELLFRNRVRTVLIVCPSSLQIQWREEMRDKFGLEFRIVDSQLVKEMRRNRGVNVNPWSHFPRLITSYDFLKRDRNLRLFRDLLPADGHPTYPRRFDMLIADECHNVAPSGKTGEASQRAEALKTIANHFEHKLFLSATPHNGYLESFAALLELLDNQRYARGAKINEQQLKGVTMVRRLRNDPDIGLRWDGSTRFPGRSIIPIEVPYGREELEIHEQLRRYGELRLKSAAGRPQQAYATEFVLKLIKKRLFSSPAAFLLTLEKHLKTLDQPNSSSPVLTRNTDGILKRLAEQLEGDRDDDATYDDSVLEAVAVATRSTNPLTEEERELIRRMLAWAERSSATVDAKGAELIAWLKSHIKPGGKWSDERVIIFTEFRDTQNWLLNLLLQEKLADPGRLLKLYGGMLPQDREQIKAAFQAGPKDSDVRILLATDAASEGINLQNHCNKLIHVEIPWNPNRLEQRNGRIDRHGQKRDVEIYHFVAKGFERTAPGQEKSALAADLEFLYRAAQKVDQIREDLGKVGPVIAEQVEQAMLGKRKALDTSVAESQVEPIRRLLKAERTVQDQVRKLRDQLADIKRDLRLTPENVRHVVIVGLDIAGQPPLEPVLMSGVREAYLLPPLTHAWESCLAGIEHPHTRQPRPIVFDHADAEGRDDVVLVHLNHRLVQMCLRLLRAQIWSTGQESRLTRFSAQIVPDEHLPLPAVVAYGRLLVLGETHQKLHEELVTAGGFIQDGRLRRMRVGEAQQAIEHATLASPPEAMRDRFSAIWPNLRQSVAEALRARTKDRTENLDATLAELASREKRNIAEILNELKRTLEAELTTPDQLPLDLGLDNRAGSEELLTRRVAQIPGEIEAEHAQIDRRFAGPTPRLFPVAVTFLVPESLARREGR
jgi:superfamily II DNA or RNA helicase